MLDRLKNRKANNTYSMKRKLTLSVEESLIENAKSQGVNISSLVENVLRHVVLSHGEGC